MKLTLAAIVLHCVGVLQHAFVAGNAPTQLRSLTEYCLQLSREQQKQSIKWSVSQVRRLVSICMLYMIIYRQTHIHTHPAFLISCLIPSLRKMLPTNNLLFSNSFSRSYRYRSVIVLELIKLPLPIPIPLPLQCPLFASLSLSAVKRCLLVTCSRPQRPPSCTQTCWAVYGKRLHMAEGPA